MDDKDTKNEEYIQASDSYGEEKRLSGLSVAAFALSFPLIFFGILYADWISCGCFFILLLITPLLGIAALRQIKHSDGKMRGKGYAIFAIVVGLIFLIMAGYTFRVCLIWCCKHFWQISP